MFTTESELEEEQYFPVSEVYEIHTLVHILKYKVEKMPTIYLSMRVVAKH